MNIEIVPTGGPLGVEVRGADLSRDPGPDVVREIVGALARHSLLIVRRQELAKERLAEIADWFGGCFRGADEPVLGDEGSDPIVIVSNVHEHGVLGGIPLAHHADQEFLREPSMATILYAVEVPPAGGDTSWSNLCQAHEEQATG